MRALLAGFTTRGKSFLAAGIAAVLSGWASASATLLSIGIVLVALPLLAALADQPGPVPDPAAPARSARRGCPAGQTATVTLRLENVSRLPTGLLLAEDTLPYSLGTRPPLRAGADRAGRLRGS